MSGKYLPKTSNIKQLCRYCLCPTKETDKWSLRYNFKTKTMIEKLIQKRDLDKLKKISQHCLTNAFYKIRFNLANERSIHGATPFEKLHHIDLGIFPRVRNVFFKTIGESGDLQLSVNGLASVYGKILYLLTNLIGPCHQPILVMASRKASLWQESIRVLFSS